MKSRKWCLSECIGPHPTLPLLQPPIPPKRPPANQVKMSLPTRLSSPLTPGSDAIPLRAPGCVEPRSLYRGWHCYLPDRLSCSGPIYLPASAPSRIQVIGGGLRGRCGGGGAHWDLLRSWRQIKIHHGQREDT